MGLGDGDLAVTGAISAGNIAVGEVSVTPVAGSSTSVTISGLSLAGTGGVYGFITPFTRLPGTTFQQATVADLSSSGMTVWVLRDNDTTTTLWWMMIRDP